MALALAGIEHAPQGPEAGPPLLIAHGLFGSARNFNTLAKRFAADRRVLAVDMRNHGDSPWDGDVSYPAQAADLAGVIRDRLGGRAVVLGHSMGGKAAMALALTEPALLSGLVVADIAPIAYAHTHAPYIAAMKGVDLSAVARRSDADPVLAAAVPEAPLRAFLLQNLVIEGGAARWRINLDALEAGQPVLTGFPADLADRRWEGPALFLRGGRSDYVPPEAEPEIRARFPRAEIETLSGAGHWMHAEAPEMFFRAVSAWLARL